MMDLQQIDELTYKRYLNMTHGLELIPNINLGYRGNENGIVYLASYLMMRDILSGYNPYRKVGVYEFHRIAANCQQEPGLFNRGQNEIDIPKETKRSISKDNITAFSSISTLLDYSHNNTAEDIYNYGKKHCFIYNNRGVTFDYPMNPSNYSIWAYNGGSKLFWLLMLPFMFINMLISLNKPINDTSSKILYFIELYPNRERFVWKYIWNWYKIKMEKQYGKKWLAGLMSIYFLPEHPNNLLANLIEEIE